MEIQYRWPDAKILIFAKTPVVGEVKTRLIPSLGDDGACSLYLTLLTDTVARFARAGLSPVELVVWPDIRHRDIQHLASQHSVSLSLQRGQDLGERMLHAATDALMDRQSVVLIGTDCPGLEVELVDQCLSSLAQGEQAALIPADDGGYVLIGLTQTHCSLFDDIEWGSDQVAGVTRERLRDLGWSFKEW
ncbi:MAG TPA: glycosyltransferase, partial [Chromatiales bacterium]|nr:glycosyltransferase [Chromatiales bacterium]